MARPSKAQQNDELVREAKDFMQEREGAESENRQAMLDDLRFAFVPGEQWTEDARRRRVGRPCFSFNRTVGAINQVVGAMRMVQPSGKLRATNRQAATATAELMAGLIRDIESRSAAQTIYTDAGKYAVAGAWGAWRLVPEYADDNSFDQVLRIKRVTNPQTVYLDEQADPWGRGAMRGMIAERISVETYKALYGDRAWTNVPAARDGKGWFSDREVRIAEFYSLVAREKQIALLSDGRVMDAANLEKTVAELRSAGVDAPTVVRKRKVKQWFCRWAKVDGAQVLEGPIEYEYPCVPIVRVPGRYVNIEGKVYYQSYHRHGKDAARAYNYDRSSMIETVALTPRAPWLLTSKMIQGYEADWGRANVSNSPYLLFNGDPDFPQLTPQRNAAPEVPQAYIALAMHDADDIRQTMGYVDPSTVNPTAAGDAESGAALRTRLMTGDASSYEFLDNFGKAIERTWEIALEMIPSIYVSERIVRIIGIDGREAFESIDPKALREAKFDVTVTLGPAYATARLEALDSLLEASERMPIVKEVAPDIIVKNMDVQGADEIERRIRQQLIARGIVEPTEEEAATLPPPPPPDPTQVALTESLEAKTDRDRAAAEKTRAEAATAAAEANAAQRRELLDLRKEFEEMRRTQAETALLLKELRAPREPSAPAST